MGCEMRCLFVKDSWHLYYGSWITVKNGTKPECDVIEIQCEKDGTLYHRFWHAQVYRKSPIPSKPKPPEKYDVHIFLIDCVGQTQFIRSLPKTVHMLRENYNAIPFHHLNKVGLNSHPNGFGLLIGKMIEDIPRSPFSKGHTAQYSTATKACYTPLDDEQYIAFRYQDDGYITMVSKGHYDNCADAVCTATPFHIHSEEQGLDANQLKGILYNDTCHEPHTYLCDYLKSFLKAYPDKPKFSITWIITLAHNPDPNSLSSTDDYFYQFFNDTRKDFENSFLFVMSDHGSRFGTMRETLMGEIEDNNPALFLSVPKPLRQNANLMQQLRTNSKELITHFDIYATLNELVQTYRIDLPKNPRIRNPLLLGSSLLHPLPKPRTCDSLKIPFEFCICRAEKTLLPKNNEIGIPAAKLMIEQINKEISSSSSTSRVCSKLSLNETAELLVEDYGGEQSVRIYKITFTTIPGNGKFWGITSYDPSDENMIILSSKFMRLDRYAEQAICAKRSILASYCYCIL
uniref:Sulfatase N-terminal domain-containing protein n=1 Tax=Panagrolaimus davidi TaxID=227884 RepID=A0A914Q7R6_9BILA